MKSSFVRKFIMGSLGAYVAKRVFRLTVSKGEPALLTLLRKLLFVRITEYNSSSFNSLSEKYGIVPEWLRQDCFYWARSDKALRPGMLPNRWFWIKGAFCFVYTRPGELIPGLYVPRWKFAKLRPLLEKEIAPKLIEMLYPTLYVSSVTESDCTEWSSRSIGVTQSLDVIPLHSGIRERIQGHMDHVVTAWKSGDMDYSRNLMFHGPKGTGKTSLITAIANVMKCDIYNFPIPEKADHFDRLASLIPAGSIVVCDEADLISQFNKATTKYKPGEFSKRQVLDYFSGIQSPPGVMNIVCTNNPDQLDDRLNRKGRFKDTIYIGEVDSDGIKYWLEKNYDYIVPDGVTLRSKVCADLFDLMDDLDDPAAFVEALTIPSGETTKEQIH